MLHRHPQRLKLVVAPPKGHPEDEAAAAEVVQGRRGLGHQDRVTEREEQHRRAQANTRGHSCRAGQERQRVKYIHGVEDAVDDPQRVQPQVIGALKERGKFRQGRRCSGETAGN